MPKKVTVEDVAEVRRLMQSQGLSLRRASEAIGVNFQTMRYHFYTPEERKAHLDRDRKRRGALHLLGDAPTQGMYAGEAKAPARPQIDVMEICRAFVRGDFDRAELSRRLRGETAATETGAAA
jgi:hypothetical protein